MPMHKHFVSFLSPGSFVSEERRLPIEKWDIAEAVRMSRDIVERYGARPYGFRFITRGRGDDDLDSREIARSGIYFLGGTVRTAEEVLAGTDPNEAVLRDNVRFNNILAIVVNDNSWRTTMPVGEGDVVLDMNQFGGPIRG